MKFYTVADDYVSFLQTFDKKVPNNGGAGYKGKKVYIGVVLEIDGHKFLAPLTSYKPDQERIKSSSPSAFKLHERTNPNNKLGLISLNYMVPVLENELAELDVAAQEEKYKKLLYLQYEFIKLNKADIIGRAQNLYEHVVVKKSDFFVRISCDIPVLIENYTNYGKEPDAKSAEDAQPAT